MMSSFLKYFTAGFLILMFQNMNAQEPVEKSVSQSVKEIDQDSKHFIHTEIGGRTFILGSLNYEYSLHKQISFGCGLGLMYIQKGDITRNNNGAEETGKYLDIGSSQMIYGNYFIGQNKHKLFMTGGLTNFLFTYRNKYTTETELSRDAQLEWNAGIGYQYSAKKIYFRLTGYCLSLPESTGWLPEYIPWVGISTGLKLK